MKLRQHVWTNEEIEQYVLEYAQFHEIEPEEVCVDRAYDGDAQVIGFRLSKGQCGADEHYGLWGQ